MAESGGQPNTDFTTHPDIRTLQGVDSEHMTTALAASVDLFNASDRIPLGDVPLEGFLHVTTEEGDVTTLQCTALPEHDIPAQFDLLGQTDDGETIRRPVRVIGSSANPDTAFDAHGPSITKGGFLHVVPVHRFRQGSDEAVPPRFSRYPNPETLNAGTLAFQKRHGGVVEGQDGKLYWQLVDEGEGLVPGRVTSVTLLTDSGAESKL